MIVSERVRERMEMLGLSQSELARRAGVAQPTIYKLLRTAKKGSTKLHVIARELRTTPAYLSGETNDPDENAPPPPSPPRVQVVTMSVQLPTEDALAYAFEGLLLASPRMAGAELARELAKRLPTLLRVAGDATAAAQSADPPVLVEGDRPHRADLAERRRA